MAATGSESSASAEQPAKAHLELSLLNKASVKTGGTWEVYMWRAFEDKYDYTWQGRPRQGTNLLRTLVNPQDPRQYCQAQFKKTSKNTAKYEEALNSYKEGGRFVMSKVGFAEGTKPEYVS